MHASGEKGRGGGRESQADSTLSMEPNAGLEPKPLRSHRLNFLRERHDIFHILPIFPHQFLLFSGFFFGGGFVFGVFLVCFWFFHFLRIAFYLKQQFPLMSAVD